MRRSPVTGEALGLGIGGPHVEHDGSLGFDVGIAQRNIEQGAVMMQAYTFNRQEKGVPVPEGRSA